MHEEHDGVAKPLGQVLAEEYEIRRWPQESVAEQWEIDESPHETFEEVMGRVVGGRLFEYAHSDRARRPVDVGQVMTSGVEPPKMLLPEELAAALLHWVYADAESAKTWLALIWAVRVMEAGGTVAWFDEELGPAVVGERLLAIGADPAMVTGRFAYLPFPAWKADSEDVESHADLLGALAHCEEYPLRLAVYDTATDALTEADLDENSGKDVTAWVKAYPEKAVRLGAAAVVLDHTTKDGRLGKNAVGSRAKRSKAKVQYAMEMESPFDRQTVGEVRLELTKNTVGAAIPRERWFRAGGDGEGGFVWEQTEGRHEGPRQVRQGRGQGG